MNRLSFLTATALAATLALAPLGAALAKNDKGGGGPGNGHGRGGASAEAGANARAGGGHGRDKWGDRAHPSELGALNAANASAAARANAAPNSRVGRIVAYEEAMQLAEETKVDLAAARQRLNALDAPERRLSAIRSDLQEATDRRAELRAEIRDLTTELEEAGGADADIEKDLETAREELAELRGEIAALTEEEAEAVAYARARAEVAELEGELSARVAVQRETLEAAANKPVTRSVVETLNTMLEQER